MSMTYSLLLLYVKLSKKQHVILLINFIDGTVVAYQLLATEPSTVDCTTLLANVAPEQGDTIVVLQDRSGGLPLDIAHQTAINAMGFKWSTIVNTLEKGEGSYMEGRIRRYIGNKGNIPPLTKIPPETLETVVGEAFNEYNQLPQRKRHGVKGLEHPKDLTQAPGVVPPAQVLDAQSTLPVTKEFEPHDTGETRGQRTTTKELIGAGHQQSKVQFEFLKAQNEDLSRQLTASSNELSTVKEVAEAQKLELETRARRKELRAKAKRQPLRDSMTYDEFNMCIELAKGESYVQCRNVVALHLLYFTGLRVSNLRNITVRVLNSLLKGEEVVVEQIKKGIKRYPIKLTHLQAKRLTQHTGCITTLTSGKLKSNYVFSPQLFPDQKLSRETLTKDLNLVLNQVSEITGKNLKSHSFRVTYITDCLKSDPLDQVSSLIGHSRFQTTRAYDRRVPSEQTISRIKENLDALREMDQ